MSVSTVKVSCHDTPHDSFGWLAMGKTKNQKQIFLTGNAYVEFEKRYQKHKAKDPSWSYTKELERILEEKRSINDIILLKLTELESYIVEKDGMTPKKADILIRRVPPLIYKLSQIEGDMMVEQFIKEFDKFIQGDLYHD